MREVSFFVGIDDEILKEVEQLRRKMICIVQKQGFTSERVITISQQIDYLLNKYNRNKQNK